MNEKELQHFEDLIIKAIQSTKSENSGLVADIKKDIAELKGNYSKRELDHFIGEIRENVVKILDQTTKTNGRVTKIEKELGMDTQEPTKIYSLSETVATLKDWRNYLLGGWALLLLLGGFIIYISAIALDKKIQDAVEQTLLDNVNKIEYEK
jgi:cell division septum initiation protein DivIVA